MDTLYIREIRIDRSRSHEPDSYVFRLPAIKSLKALKPTSPVTILVGENGTGKSTLLEAIAVAYGFNAEGGSLNFNFATKDTHSPLYQSTILGKGATRPRDGFFLRAESFYNVATEVDRLNKEGPPTLYRSYGGKSLHDQSHGESFLSLIMNRFFGKGLYLLDEPEAALSPAKQLALLARIHELVQMDSQFFIATHSPILMGYPGAQLLALSEEGVKNTPYEDLDHVQIMRLFLENRQRVLRDLFD